MSEKTIKIEWQIGALRPFLQDPNFSTDDKLTLIEEVIQKTVEPIQTELESLKVNLRDANGNATAWEHVAKSSIKERNLARAELEKDKKSFDLLSNERYKLSDALKQAQAERDELKAALKPFQDYPDDFSKEAPKDKFTMTVFCSDIAKAQQLLKAKP